MNNRFQHIAIIGPGLLGSSLGLAARHLLPDSTIVSAWARRESALADILSYGVAELATNDLAQAVKGADLVILATPVGVMPQLLPQLIPALSPQALVTDVGSVKGMVHETVGKILTANGIPFIGSHPMAGSEKQGITAARETLFVNAPIVITNNEKAPQILVDKLQHFWEELGGRIYHMDAHEHDSSIARVSHLPHTLAALTSITALNDGKEASLGELCGGGFRDTSRVCSGNPVMWSEILLENKEALIPLLTQASQELEQIVHLLSETNQEKLQHWLESARNKREISLSHMGKRPDK